MGNPGSTNNPKSVSYLAQTNIKEDILPYYQIYNSGMVESVKCIY